ncbi:ETC complex I subunit [Fodinicurvata sediminis]|uniref:ETC complex I subunit n=1 Tax=Fodinicurvata sediminis TaxID=1121832 RepID=UPI0003B3534B|nr:ETC complex I subunit [Fodinicurvata sediminis]
MQVRIYQMPKTAMQSGRALTKRWVLEFEPQESSSIEPLMGWSSSRDTRQQLRIWFDTREEAEEYARKKGYMYTVDHQHEREIHPKAYADNFKYSRLLRWTH